MKNTSVASVFHSRQWSNYNITVQAETVVALRADVDGLRSKLKASEEQRSSLTERVDELNQQLATLRQPDSGPTPASSLGNKPSLANSEIEVGLRWSCLE